MDAKKKSVLVVGFNTRPLAYSLFNAGYEVYVVDFFGDLDLYPYVIDSIIVTKKLSRDYDSIKGSYSKYLTKFTIEMLNKYPDIDYLIIGSGLDDDIGERRTILKEIKRKKYPILDLNNDIEAIIKARNIESIYNILKEDNYKVPLVQSYDKIISPPKQIRYPFILKKKMGSGGINIYKIENKEKFNYVLDLLKTKEFNPKNWLLEEYIKGIPVSCTIISNGNESKLVSVNRQIIGENYLNAPKEFMYCGNVVPANLLDSHTKLISDLSISLATRLGLKGINGFDFVLKNHNPYLMEINPRIPGSIRASECVMNLNLLDLYIQSFNPMKWENVKNKLKHSEMDGFATKLIFFAPKEVKSELVEEINNLNYVHDKSEPIRNISKDEPLCSILYKAETFSTSYFGALKIVDEIYNIIT